MLPEDVPSLASRRTLAVVAAVLLVLVALHAALGYLVAPRLIRSTLVERAAAAGLELRFGAIATHPFSLAADAHDVQLSTRDGHRLVSAHRASVDLSASSLWRRAWVLERVSLEAPVLYGLPSVSGGKKDGEAQLPALIVRELDASGGRLELAGAPHLSDLALEAHDVSTLAGHANKFSASAKLAGGGTARTEGTVSLATSGVSGHLVLAGAAIAEAWRYLPKEAGPAPRGTLGGSLAYRYGGGKLALSDASAEARLASGGSLSLALDSHGRLELPPFRADLRLRAQALPVSLAQPFLAAHTKLTLAAGTLSGEGRLQLGERPRYDGSAAIRDARIDGPRIDGHAGELGGWASLATGDLHLEFAPFAARAGEVTATQPRVNMVIGPRGELNLARAFAGGGEASASASRPAIQVARLVIEQGSLDFADHSVPSSFATHAQSLNGAITQVDTSGDTPARVQLAGRVGRYGEARVRGAVDLTAPSSRTSVELHFRNLALPDFTPYVAKFAGYRIASGRLNADLRYRVREGRLVGDNRLTFERLRLGEKVQSASALDLPIDLAVALLTDAEGRIDLAIPVRGDLRDPQVDLGGLIAQAVRNTLGKIVSAPFRMLASLFGGKDRRPPGNVRFEPGSAALSPPDEEHLARLARALARRPHLGLAVHGAADPQADREALQRAALLRELAKRAGYAAAGASGAASLDPRDPRFVRAAERLHRDRGGKTRDLAPLKPHERGYGRRLIEALTPGTPVADDALAALARSRAEAIRDALVRNGVDAGRVQLAGPVEARAGEASDEERGVPTSLELQANNVERQRK